MDKRQFGIDKMRDEEIGTMLEMMNSIEIDEETNRILGMIKSGALPKMEMVCTGGPSKPLTSEEIELSASMVLDDLDENKKSSSASEEQNQPGA